MKIPLNWLKDFVKLPVSTKDLTDKLTMAGHMLDKTIKVEGEVVIDLELRGNRADCYSIYGIAREVSALFNSKLKHLPVIDLKRGNFGVDLKATTPLVKRVGMVEINNVAIKPSPKWLSQRLKAYGIDTVNNIVDLTNYVMIETGEPLHAFDLDKVGKSLSIRLAENGEKLTTFMGTSITLTSDDLVWAKGGQILSVAGAVGEKYNSISPDTKNVLLEAANYDRANIRKTVYKHKLFTDAGIRHEKELDPEMVETAIGRFLYLLRKNNWGTFSPVFSDYYPKKVIPSKISITQNNLESLGGVKIDKKEITGILKRLFFKIISDKAGEMSFEVPTYRTDVLGPEDLTEEILRVYGYDRIPDNVLSLPIPKNITPKFIFQEEALRASAIASGFNEIISNSFVGEKLSRYNLHPSVSGNEVVGIINPPSPDNRNMRITLFPNLYEHAVRAINEREEKVCLFEIGKTYVRHGNHYKEERKIGFIFYEKDKGTFIKFKTYILGFFRDMNFPELEFINDAVNLPMTQSFLVMLGREAFGFGGTIDRNIYYLELDLDMILDKKTKYSVKLWPKYPPQIEDLTFSLPEKTKIGEVAQSIKEISPFITKVVLMDIYHDSYTFNIEYQDPNKTLTDEEVEKIRKNILLKVKSKFGGSFKD